MATTKEKGLYVLIALALIIGGAVIYYVFFRDECDPNRNGFTKKGKPSDKCKVDNPSSSNVPPPSGSQWTSDSEFPLKKGSWGAKVKAWQKALGFSDKDQDGRFGSQTESATITKIGKPTVDQADYDKLVNPTPKPSGGNTTVNPVGKIAKAKVNNVSVFYDSDFSLYKTAQKGEYIGTIIGDASDKNYFLINGTAGSLVVLKTLVTY